MEHKRAVYVCRSCDKRGVESNFVTAEAPKPLIEKSLVSASMLSEIINQKYCMGVPLYRLEAEFKNMQINLSRQTMANWIITASNLVKPVYEQMHKELLNSEILHADETTLEVLEEPGRNPQAKSYMWVYTTGKSEEKNIILYDYQQGRSGTYAKTFLKGFKGYIHRFLCILQRIFLRLHRLMHIPGITRETSHASPWGADIILPAARRFGNFSL